MYIALEGKISIVDWLLAVRIRKYSTDKGWSITDEGLQNLGICSALTASQQGGIFIVPYLFSQGASVYTVPSEG